VRGHRRPARPSSSLPHCQASHTRTARRAAFMHRTEQNRCTPDASSNTNGFDRDTGMPHTGSMSPTSAVGSTSEAMSKHHRYLASSPTALASTMPAALSCRSAISISWESSPVAPATSSGDHQVSKAHARTRWTARCAWLVRWARENRTIQSGLRESPAAVKICGSMSNTLTPSLAGEEKPGSTNPGPSVPLLLRYVVESFGPTCEPYGPLPGRRRREPGHGRRRLLLRGAIADLCQAGHVVERRWCGPRSDRSCSHSESTPTRSHPSTLSRRGISGHRSVPSSSKTPRRSCRLDAGRSPDRTRR
jgi:hypothetical protein